jgi:hypothetical protein
MPTARHGSPVAKRPGTEPGHDEGIGGTGGRQPEGMVKRRTSASVIAALALLLAAGCTGKPAAPGAASPSDLGLPPAGLSRVILVGDSVALGNGLAVGAAFGAAGVEFHSMASAGGGTVVGPPSGETWAKLPGLLEAAKPSTVIYQITSYDWGTEKEQKAAYERLLTTVAGAGAKLVMVTMPPIRPDDFYAGHMDELAHAPKAAREVMRTAGDKGTFLDAGAVWGEKYERARDGRVERSSDGVHTCPQGAARFTAWLLAELGKVYPGFTAPDAATWTNTGWAGDGHFVGC